MPTLATTAPSAQPAMDPAVLVERIRAGDPLAEEELVTRFSRPIRLLLARHTRRPADAEDLYQDTFHRAFEKLRAGELRQPEKLPAFLAGLARNLAIEIYRKAGRRKTEADSEAVEAASRQQAQLGEVLRGEQALLVRRLLGELRNERDRQILYRFYLAEEDKETIAADFALDSLQFNRVLHRARGRYKELLLERLGEDAADALLTLSSVVLMLWLLSLWSLSIELHATFRVVASHTS